MTQAPDRPGSASTFDEDLLCWRGAHREAGLSTGDAARIDQITREFAARFTALSGIDRAVSVFGSARIGRADPAYELARDVARCLGGAGYAVITGGGPGIMEAANRGAREAGALSVGCGIELPHEQLPNGYLDVWLEFRLLLRAQGDVRPLRHRLRDLPRGLRDAR